MTQADDNVKFREIAKGLLKDSNIDGFNKLREDMISASLGQSAADHEGVADSFSACLMLLDLSGADLSDDGLTTDLSDADFRVCNLAGVNFTNAQLHRVNFRGADLTGATFKGANCRDAVFGSQAQLDYVASQGANVTDATVEEMPTPDPDPAHLIAKLPPATHAALALKFELSPKPCILFPKSSVELYQKLLELIGIESPEVTPLKPAFPMQYADPAAYVGSMPLMRGKSHAQLALADARKLAAAIEEKPELVAEAQAALKARSGWGHAA